MHSIPFTTGLRRPALVAERRTPVEYDALFVVHGPALRRYAYRFVRSRDQAEDIVQDVFLHLWMTWDRLEIGAATRSYLFVATRTRALSHLRRARTERSSDGGASGGAFGAGDPVDAFATTVPLSTTERDARDRAHGIVVAIERVLADLPPRQREVAALRLWHQRSTLEIAAHLGISARTVEVHVGRAMKSLRAGLPRHLGSNDAPVTHE